MGFGIWGGWPAGRPLPSPRPTVPARFTSGSLLGRCKSRVFLHTPKITKEYPATTPNRDLLQLHRTDSTWLVKPCHRWHRRHSRILGYPRRSSSRHRRQQRWTSASRGQLGGVGQGGAARPAQENLIGQNK